MMRFGTFVFSLLKKNQQKNKQRIIDEYVIFSKVEIGLKSSKKVTCLSDLNQFKNLSKKNIEIIIVITIFNNTNNYYFDSLNFLINQKWII